jgi:hypothetical protein
MLWVTMDATPKGLQGLQLGYHPSLSASSREKLGTDNRAIGNIEFRENIFEI